MHLYGNCCWDECLVGLVRKYGLWVVEDAAQSIGAEAGLDGLFGGGNPELWTCRGNQFLSVEKFGSIGRWGGCAATYDAELAEVVRALANYGSERRYYNKYRGYNSRLDELQAAFLSVKLACLEDDNRRRQELAAIYDKAITAAEVIKPQLKEAGRHIYHQYVVRFLVGRS